MSGGALLTYLQDNGLDVEVLDREVNDKPDMYFRAGLVRIGCECVQIPPGRIYKYVHSRFKQLEGSDATAIRIVWPQEQHYWVKEAIESKTKKINAYKKNCKAEKIWLLIHSPISEKDTTVRYEKEEVMNLMKYAAKKTPHNFDEIYFWDPKQGITQIYPLSDVWESVQFNFEGGYPTDGFVMSKASFKTTDYGENPVVYDHGVVVPDVIIVPPLDPEFKKHKPRFKNTKYRIKITAGTTEAKSLFEPVDE